MWPRIAATTFLPSTVSTLPDLPHECPRTSSATAVAAAPASRPYPQIPIPSRDQKCLAFAPSMTCPGGVRSGSALPLLLPASISIDPPQSPGPANFPSRDSRPASLSQRRAAAATGSAGRDAPPPSTIPKNVFPANPAAPPIPVNARSSAANARPRYNDDRNPEPPANRSTGTPAALRSATPAGASVAAPLPDNLLRESRSAPTR